MAKHKNSRRPRPPQPETKSENPFERMYCKKKFSVLGKKLKGTNNTRGASRNDAFEKRKNTLLVEYKQLRKANLFLDKRIGETDDDLADEDKALARFQKQRMREVSGAALEADEGGTDPALLTHGGKPLSVTDGFRQDTVFGSDDERDAALDNEMVTGLNFGGGFVQKIGREGESDDLLGTERRRFKKEVMEEVIAKSKAAKAAKQLQREEDLTATEQLDAAFQQLLKGRGVSALLHRKGDKGGGTGSADGEDAAYDVVRRELVFEAKARVEDRTKTPEELAVEQQRQLQALERQRLKRMRGDDGGDDEQEIGLPAGGYAGKRARMKLSEGQSESDADEKEGDEAGEEMGEDEEHEAGDNTKNYTGRRKLGLQARQQERAAGSHPLQASFREAAAQLAAKYGAAAVTLQRRAGKLPSADSYDETADSDESGEDGEELSEEQQLAIPDRTAQDQLHVVPRQSTYDEANVHKFPASTKPSAGDVPLDKIPYVLQAPQTYQEYAELMEGRSPEEVQLIVARIRASNAIALAASNRRHMQILYGFMVQHFALEASKQPLPLAMLDALTCCILAATPEVAFYAATVAHTRLMRHIQRLHAALRPGINDEGKLSRGWPSQSTICMLALWCTVFPTSDRRHPVTTPIATLLSAYLALCRPSGPSDVAVGLLLAGMAVGMARPGRRMVPEVLGFATSVIQSATPLSEGGLQVQGSHWLTPQDAAAAAAVSKVQPLQLSEVLSGETSPQATQDAMRLSCLAAALHLVDGCSAVCAHLPASPEILSATLKAIQALAECQWLPRDITTLRDGVALRLQSQVQACIQSRCSLQQKTKKAVELRQYNPRFEEDFAAGKDYDPDRERAQERRLQRQINRERRGAMRELRKDAVFLSEHRTLEKKAAQMEKKANLRAAMSFLQQQESDFKSGSQSGMWKKNKRR